MTSRPNILLVLQDQLRYDVVADPALCRTPAFDRLATAGLSFDRCYTPIGICSAARASLFTGLYPHTHGVLNNVTGTDVIRAAPEAAYPTIAELLAATGYTTGFVGKWHVGLEDGPAQRGFTDVRTWDQEYWGAERYALYRDTFADPALDCVRTTYGEPLPRLAERFPPMRFPIYYPEPVSEDAVPAREACDLGVEMLRDYGKTGDPFFAVVSFIEPHWPHLLPEPWFSMYDPADIEPWTNFDDSFVNKPRTNEAGLEHFGVGHMTWDDWAPAVAAYLGACTYLDHLVGSLLHELDEAGLAENTVVVASADHGDLTGSHRQFNKGPLAYEEVYRIPFIVRGPGVRRGRTNALASLVDLLPTSCELTGVTPPQPCHGRSLAPVLAAPPRDWRDALLCEFHGDEFGLYSQRMIVTETHKLVYNPNDLRELYDLRDDPAELHNLAYESALGALRRDLEGRLLELMWETDDGLRTLARNVLGLSGPSEASH